jgi:RHS repeat-associated protein
MLTANSLRRSLVMLRHLLITVLAGVVLIVPRPGLAQSDTVVYYHLDAVGSVRVITDQNGAPIGPTPYDYLPFGQTLDPPTPPADPREFAELERDPETTFDYAGARYYSSHEGRFTTPDDPLYMDPLNPQSMNRYAYAYNNPLRWVDSTGHEPCPPGSVANFCAGVTAGLDSGTSLFMGELVR